MKYGKLTTQLLLIGLVAVSTAMSAQAQTRPRESAPPAASRKIVPVPRDTIRVDIWFDKQCGAAYREGEKIIINFRTDVDGYLTVYDIDTRGQVSVLFPNKQYPDNYVRGGQTYSFPDRSYSYDLMVEGPEGIEYVDAVASTDPNYRWNYREGEPYWVRDWGLKGRSAQQSSSNAYKSSTEYQNRPQELGSAGEQSLARNFDLSTQMREEIRSKIIVQPRAITETPRETNYGTATCYFYVVSAAPVRVPRSNDYWQQQEREFEQIPGFDARQSQGRLIVTIPNTILFRSGSYQLENKAFDDLTKVAQILNRYQENRIKVVGHTDSDGSEASNQRLSEYRAQNVANFLLNQGVAQFRISIEGRGELDPIASNRTAAGKQLNRRVELIIE